MFKDSLHARSVYASLLRAQRAASRITGATPEVMAKLVRFNLRQLEEAKRQLPRVPQAA
jgi:hypothetical protein